MKSQELSAIRDLQKNELETRLKETNEKLFKLRISNSMSPLKNSMQIRDLRKLRARLLTWIRQKELSSTK